MPKTLQVACHRGSKRQPAPQNNDDSKNNEPLPGAVPRADSEMPGTDQPADGEGDNQTQHQLARESLDGHTVNRRQTLTSATAMAPGAVYITEDATRQDLIQESGQIILPNRNRVRQSQTKPFHGIAPAPGRKRNLDNRKRQCRQQHIGGKTGKLFE